MWNQGQKKFLKRGGRLPGTVVANNLIFKPKPAGSGASSRKESPLPTSSNAFYNTRSPGKKRPICCPLGKKTSLRNFADQSAADAEYNKSPLFMKKEQALHREGERVDPGKTAYQTRKKKKKNGSVEPVPARARPPPSKIDCEGCVRGRPPNKAWTQETLSDDAILLCWGKRGGNKTVVGST